MREKGEISDTMKQLMTQICNLNFAWVGQQNKV